MMCKVGSGLVGETKLMSHPKFTLVPVLFCFFFACLSEKLKHVPGISFSADLRLSRHYMCIICSEMLHCHGPRLYNRSYVQNVAPVKIHSKNSETRGNQI